MPLYARDFLGRLPQISDLKMVIAALTPLLRRPALVSQRRRAAVIAGCFAFPLFAAVAGIFGLMLVQEWSQRRPGLMELSGLLQTRWAMHFFSPKKPGPSDQQYGVYIASHFRHVITNQASWSDPFALIMIKGEARRFAEQSLTNYPAPSDQEIAEAAKALKPYLQGRKLPKLAETPWFTVTVFQATLAIYVGLPALVAALVFRGGLVLRIAGIAFVRRDGARASRPRVFWRGLVAWMPLLVPFFLLGPIDPARPWCASLVAAIVVCGLMILSLALPGRGLPDRLAGTWPVPR